MIAHLAPSEKGFVREQYRRHVSRTEVARSIVKPGYSRGMRGVQSILPSRRCGDLSAVLGPAKVACGVDRKRADQREQSPRCANRLQTGSTIEERTRLCFRQPLTRISGHSRVTAPTSPQPVAG